VSRRLSALDRRHAAAAVALAATPRLALAHLDATGMGPLYDGVSHLLLSPEDLVPAAALALLAGLRGAPHGRRVLLVLPLAWFVGGLAGSAASSATASPLLSGLWFLALGALVAADARVPLSVTAGLAALLGAAHGWLNGSGMGRTGAATTALVGLTAAVFVLVALSSAFVVSLRAGWARIAVRVAGSWVAASGLLMLGWSFRGR
jgi:urease accessory protein